MEGRSCLGVRTNRGRRREQLYLLYLSFNSKKGVCEIVVLLATTQKGRVRGSLPCFLHVRSHDGRVDAIGLLVYAGFSWGT